MPRREKKILLPLSVQKMGEKKQRTTIIFDDPLAENLKAYGLSNSLTVGEVVSKFCADGLRKEGYQPDKVPKVTVSY